MFSALLATSWPPRTTGEEDEFLFVKTGLNVLLMVKGTM